MIADPSAPKRGDRFVAYADADHPRQMLYIEVTRTARDGTWADIRVCNCFVMWTKRQRLPLPECTPQYWTQTDIDDQWRRWDAP